MDVLPDEGEPIPEMVTQRFQARRLIDALRRLGRRERQVLQLRYGIGTPECRTQREIARDLGISRSYVSRIEKKAMKHIRSAWLQQGD